MITFQITEKGRKKVARIIVQQIYKNCDADISPFTKTVEDGYLVHAHVWSESLVRWITIPRLVKHQDVDNLLRLAILPGETLQSVRPGEDRCLSFSSEP